MRGRDAVRQAVRATRVRPHVPPDRRHLLRGRVRHVRESRAEEGDAEIEVEQAWLDPRQPVLGPDLEDAVHLRRDDHEGVADRCGRAREPGTAPSRDHRQVVHRGRADARGDVVGGTREDHETGRALDHRRIACVEAERQGVRQHLVRTERSLELPPRRVQIRHVARVGRDGDLGRVRARRAGAGRVREGTARRAGLLPCHAPHRWIASGPSGGALDRRRSVARSVPRPQSQGRRGPPRRSLRPPLADGQPRRCGR